MREPTSGLAESLPLRPLQVAGTAIVGWQHRDMLDRVGVIVLVGFLAASSLAAAELTTLAGERLQAEALMLQDGAVLAGDRRVPLAEIDWLLLAAAPRQPAAADSLAVVLADGSFLSVQRLQAAAQADALQVVSPLGVFVLPLGEALLGWGPAEWLDRPLAGKQDLLLLRDGDGGSSLVAGRLNGIRAGELSFEAEHLGEIAYELAAVAGLRLAIAPVPPQGLALQARLLADRPPVWLRWDEAGFHLAALPQVAAQGPAVPLQVHGGRRVWLSDLPVVPELLIQEGAFGTVWEYSTDANLDASPLMLGGVRYDKGVVVHSRAQLVWQLDGRFDLFHAHLGIADLVGREGDCTVRLLVDETVVFERLSLRGSTAPVALHLPLKNAERLTLRVDFGARYDIGDHVALAGAWLRRKAPDNGTK